MPPKLSEAGVAYHDPVAKLTAEEVAHVALLARLTLTDEELDLYTVQLAAVLNQAADLEALDTEGVPPTARPIHLANVTRPDEPGPCLPRDEVLSQAPAVEGGRFEVPRILADQP